MASGDIFISIDRVRDNAKDFGVPFEQELRRVIIHGVLHLCGYGDKTDAEALVMRGRKMRLWRCMRKEISKVIARDEAIRFQG